MFYDTDDMKVYTLFVPAEYEGAWAVEEEFVRLVRGEIDEPELSIADGVKNIEYLDACHRSAAEGQWVAMPST